MRYSCWPVLLPLLVLSTPALAQESEAAPPAEAPSEPPPGEAAPPPAEAPSEPSAPEAPPPPAADAAPVAPAADIEAFSLEELLNPTVVSASRQAEPLSEVPVPATIITSDMIRAIGARNLQEILVTYVPGMSRTEDHNELNVAMRGVYGSSQQKILVMIDGHRLNSRAYLSANPDAGINIDPNKVDRIEVLRGPGSAVYGNVALTGVINIVTKEGADINGVHVEGGLGNFGAKSARLTYGGQFNETTSLVLWGSIYSAEGEERSIEAPDDFVTPPAVPRDGTILLGAVRQPPAYDVGGRFEVGNWHLLVSQRSSMHVEPFTAAGATGHVYDYDLVRTLQGHGPGLASRSTHAEIGWVRMLTDKLELSVEGGYDQNSILANTTTSGANAHLFLDWHDQAVTGTVQARYSYDLSGLGEGNVLVGLTSDWWRLYDSARPAGGAGGDWETFADRKKDRLLKKGHEATHSAYVQLKQKLTPMFLVNAGARFDYKLRRRTFGTEPVDLRPPEVDDITELSPRAAVVFTPNDMFDVKLSYSKSFVDGPYWYRYNNLPTYRGSTNLQPEIMQAVQLTPTVRFFGGQLQNTANFAFNQLTDGVYRVPDAEIDPANPVYYQNSGKLITYAVEDELAFIGSWYRLRGNVTFLYAQDVEQYLAYSGDDFENKIWNIPQLFGNVIVDVSPFFIENPEIWLNVTAHLAGEQEAPINGVSANRPDAAVNLQNTLPARAIIDAGLRVTGLPVVPELELAGHVYNLLDQRYKQGGSTRFPYPQTGRWFLVTLGYHFTP